MRIIDYIEQAAQQLEHSDVSFGHGTTNAFDEAVWLVLWRLGLPLDNLEDVEQQEINDLQMLQALNQLIQQRISTRKPAAYLTHEAWLQGIPFYVDERTIVPRSLISENLAQGDIDPWLERAVYARSDTTPHILDLCTGNGSLAILCAMAWPDAVVTASDISPEALAVARINIDKHQLSKSITLLESDGLNNPSIKKHAPFDLIVCNPPYVNEQSMQELPQEYKAEPELALAGGLDGMNFIRTLLTQIADYLSPEGILVLEIGNEHLGFEAAFPMLEALWLPTSAGDDQVLLLSREVLLHELKN